MTLSGHKPPLTTEQSLRTSQRLDGTSVVVAVHGEIDLCSATHLRARLVTALDTATGTSSCVVVDLRRVEFLGAAGLAVLAETVHRAEARGTKLRIVADDSCPAARVLPIAHLDHALAPGSRPTP